MVWKCTDLNLLGGSNKVTLHWMPENIGVEEDEKTDELARKVSSTSLVGPKLFCGLGDAFF